MERAVLIAVLALAAIQCYGAVQVQMPETAELQMEDSDLQAQIKELQKNVSDIWTYIYELRSAVSQHLTHLRQHQVEIETTVHKMEHLHEDSHTHGSSHGDSHHHSGDDHHHSGDDHHSHSGEQHSHGDDHGSDHHSHSSHSGEQHSHSGEHHSHSGEHHSHSGEHGHHSHSYSHSHSHGGHDHSKEDGSHASHSHDESEHHHHDQDRKDSHETEDLTQTTQQVQQVSPPVAEPVVVPTNRREHYHHHHHHESRTGSPSGSGMNLMGEHSFHSHHHHGHEDSTSTTSSSSSKNRTVILPRYSDYDQYDFATCNVQANRAISEELQQDVEGTVTLWQKKSGGPLNFHVRLQGFKIGDHHGHHGAHQAIQQEEDNETPQEAGHRHGFHIHASGDLSNGCQSTGPHYNPKTVNHGGPTALVRHIGDLGNIECDNHGITNILFSDDLTSLRGQYSVIGKAIVIHADLDDLGQGGDEESLKTGNAGTRIACCVIQRVNKLPIRSYRAMKTAIQYQNR